MEYALFPYNAIAEQAMQNQDIANTASMGMGQTRHLKTLSASITTLDSKIMSDEVSTFQKQQLESMRHTPVFKDDNDISTADKIQEEMTKYINKEDMLLVRDELDEAASPEQKREVEVV